MSYPNIEDILKIYSKMNSKDFQITNLVWVLKNNKNIAKTFSEETMHITVCFEPKPFDAKSET